MFKQRNCYVNYCIYIISTIIIQMINCVLCKAEIDEKVTLCVTCNEKINKSLLENRIKYNWPFENNSKQFIRFGN